jgi:hypothetical protein
VDSVFLAKAFSCAFFAVVFIQSSLDKVFDRKGNLEWLTPQFSKTVFRGVVPAMLTSITLIELAAGFGCAFGLAAVLLRVHPWAPTMGLGFACLALVSLVAGQRISKDYAGAAALAGYFAVALFGLWISGMPSR